MKMKQVYESNPALGDPMSIQGQLTENGHKLDKLRAELKKFQVGIFISSSRSSASTEFFVVRHPESKSLPVKKWIRFLTTSYVG